MSTFHDFGDLSDFVGAHDACEQATALRSALMTVSQPELETLYREAVEARNSLFSGELWCAAELMLQRRGGAGEDAFEELLDWLILQGRETMNLARSNPDRLAGRVDAFAYGEIDGFALLATCNNVYDERFGAELRYPDNLSPIPWLDEPMPSMAELKNMYPLLWACYASDAD